MGSRELFLGGSTFVVRQTSFLSDGRLMRIRPYRSDDLPAIKSITVDAFDGVSIDQGIDVCFGAINGRDWRWRKARHIDEDVRRNADGVFVAEQDDRVVGSICTWQDRDAGIGHIPNISIDAEYRGQGLGRRLLEHAFDHFRQCGLTHAKIETLVQNEIGNHLYRELGFREVARQIHFVADLNRAGPEE
jgi:ribosomal protein S18 acetylase RimI-like enzyme